MKILKAIGNVFVKIWRWIKNTAWVQPLLIVGAIFGVIFSIPAITSGIQGLINGNNSADNFYKGFKKSLEGAQNSQIDLIIEHYNDYKKEEESGKAPAVPTDELKYFVMFTQEGNQAAKDMKDGIEVLKNNWGTNFIPLDNTVPFKLYTVYTDEVTSETKTDATAFSQFLDRKSWFFEQASAVGLKSQYHINDKISKADLDTLGDADPSTFKTPTILLVDWTKAITKEQTGITEVMFDVPGEDSYAKAKLLLDCWNATGDFAPKK